MTLTNIRPRAKTRSSARQPSQVESPTAEDSQEPDTANETRTPSAEERPGGTHLLVDTAKTAKRSSLGLGKRNLGSAGTAPSSATTAVLKSSIPTTTTEAKSPTPTATEATAGNPNVATQQQQQSAATEAQHQPPVATGDLTLTQIISEYGERTDLLRLVLAAKTEQDRAKAEYERRLQEEMRFETRRLEFEMMLHDNYFKQQEQQKQQMVGPLHQHHPPIPPHAAAAAAGHIHRNDMVLHSPIGPPQQVHYHPAHHKHPPGGHGGPPQQQQQQAGMHMAPPQNGTYGAPPPSASSMRSYHHPDTPGGPDAQHSGQNPFAFFKMPLGTQIQHPSAYAMHEKHAQRHAAEHLPGGMSSHETQGGPTSRPGGGGTNGASKHRTSPPRHENAADGSRQKRTVPPAVSGLSLRIGGGMGGGADAPRSAPVDGLNQKRKISHDEVIMALRRKVMGKNGGAAAQPQSQQQQQQPPPPPHAPHKHMPPPPPPHAKTAAPAGAHRRFGEDQLGVAIRRSSLANNLHLDSPDNQHVLDDVRNHSSSSSTTSEDFPL
ncbi:hypothetical protein EV175_005377, partial [Coemansia sp. RSA 1933]